MKARPGWRVLRVEGGRYPIQFVAHGRKHWARRGEWPYHIMVSRCVDPRRKRHAMRTRRLRIARFHARMQAIAEMTAPRVLAPPTYRPIEWVNASDWGKDA